MALIVPIRADAAYFGFAKEATSGVPVAPSLFPRWMDGSQLEIDVKMEDVWEGDGTRHLSTIIKNRQTVKIKWVGTPRPNELGFFETAQAGAVGDVVTNAAVSTTLAAASIAGATSISVAANTGLTGSTAIAIVLEPGTATEEIAIFLPPVTGAGPYTLNVSASYNGGQLRLPHANSGVVRSATIHTITDQFDGNYYTIEVSLGLAIGITLRVRDCKVETTKVSGKAGGLLMYELEWVGIASTVQGAPATVTLENHNPFLYTQGVWTLDGSLTGDALVVESFDISRKNNLDTDIQTENVYLAAMIFGRLQVDITIEIVFLQGNTRIQSMFFGGPTGTTDAQAVATGALNLIFTLADTFNSVQYNCPTLIYSKVQVPTPKIDGKHFKQALNASSVSNQGQNTTILTTTVTNTQTTAY